jgi:hypothetical protein
VPRDSSARAGASGVSIRGSMLPNKGLKRVRVLYMPGS